MKFDEYILEELSFHKWKLKSGFEFKKNKVVKVKVKKFSPEEISFLFSLSMACLLYSSSAASDVYKRQRMA